MLSVLSILIAFSVTTGHALSTFTDDIDGDGLLDTQEDVNGNGIVDMGETDFYNADSDSGGESDGSEKLAGRNPLYKMDDFTFDQDNDGLTNGEEMELGTSQTNPDTDNDGINDKNDPFPLDAEYNNDEDGDGLPDDFEEDQDGLSPNDPSDAEEDQDNDGISNIEEFVQGTDIANPDTDWDGWDDAEDAFPLSPSYHQDNDNDGLPDSYESEHGLSSTDPSDAQQDNDGDGLSNLQEFQNGTNPNESDTDNDGILDGTEVELETDPIENACLFYAELLTEFTDIKTHWAKNYIAHLHRIKILYEHIRIVDGFGDGPQKLFKPEQEISRFELLKMALLGNCIQLSHDQPNLSVDFKDVSSQHRPFEHPDIKKQRRVVYTAVRKGIVKGYSDNSFRPSVSANRAEALKILILSSGFNTPQNELTDTKFLDISQRDWFAPYVKQATDLGVIKGYEDGTFRPNQPITRAEVAKILLMLMKQNVNINSEVIHSD
ncbi:MAG: S-layer homology domain-containing protein [Kiritimatiellales bacterium]|nr:S-layer homology domain-containing protein [Kiritimatiellales bacterium]